MPSDGNWVAWTSAEESREGDATEGAAGRGGSNVTLKDVSSDDDMGSATDGCGAVTGLGAVTGALYKKGSDAIMPTAGEDCSGALSARSGLMGRHSSSKVTERLEMTVLVEG